MREVGRRLVRSVRLQHMSGSRWLGVSSLGPWPDIERRILGRPAGWTNDEETRWQAEGW